MSTQRPARERERADGGRGGGSDRETPSRRRFLGALGTAAVSAGGGCVAGVGGAVERSTRPVSVLAAGSLQLALEEGLREAASIPVQVETHGSVTVARLVASGKRDPDVVALADAALFENPLGAVWYAEFATNALVVAYDDSPGGRRVADADRWFDPVLAGEATLGRTDPDLDPLGYRTLFALELGAAYYDRPGLRADLVEPDQVYPETSLLSRFETGSLDTAVVYRNMAVERGYDFLDLPAAIDLGSPGRADDYASATYELANGRTVRGGPISYAARARSTDDRVRSVYDRLVTGSYLDEYGFGTPAPFPRYRGAVPREVRG